MLNKMILIGRLTKDVEMSVTHNGAKIGKFTVAINEGNTTTFVPCTTWNKLAENCSKFIKKGSLVCVEGKLQILDYKDVYDQYHQNVKVIADSVDFLDSKS